MKVCILCYGKGLDENDKVCKGCNGKGLVKSNKKQIKE